MLKIDLTGKACARRRRGGRRRLRVCHRESARRSRRHRVPGQPGLRPSTFFELPRKGQARRNRSACRTATSSPSSESTRSMRPTTSLPTCREDVRNEQAVPRHRRFFRSTVCAPGSSRISGDKPPRRGRPLTGEWPGGEKAAATRPRVAATSPRWASALTRWFRLRQPARAPDAKRVEPFFR